MTTISQKEKILLGYDPNSPPKTPSRNSDIDFSDVFGGPPRRSSHHSEDNDGYTWRRGDEEGNSEMETGRSRSRSIKPSEKPVFGSEVSSRRRHQGQDFYDDIFRGDSQSSSPRISARDPMSSSPGSRVLSPARPLPPGVVPLGSPAQFSLPARLATSHSTSSLSRQSPLSYKSAAAADREDIRKNDNMDKIGGETQVKNAGNQFHFSMHKWANKGTPLVMSLGSKNSLRSKIMLERSLSLNEHDEVESDTLVGEIQSIGVNTNDVLSFKVHVVSTAKDSKESDQIFDKSEHAIPNSRTILQRSASKEMKNVTKPDASKSVLKRSSSKLGVVEGKTGTDSAVSEVRVNKRVVENKSAASSNADKKEHNEVKGESKKNNLNNQKKLGQDSKESDQIVDKSEPDIPILRTVLKRSASKEMKNMPKPDIYASKSALKRSSSKLGGVEGQIDNDSAIPEVRVNKKVVENKSAASSNVDKKEQSKPKKEQSDLKGDQKKNLGYDTAKEKVNKETEKDGGKGKVKDFVKIFNTEPIIKTVADLDGLSNSGRWRNVELPRENSQNTSPKVDESHTTPSSEKQSDSKNMQESYRSSFMESETKASVNLKASNADIDAEFDSILIEELPQVEDKTPENSENTEDMQAYESKIVKWSKGKEGNIRALLSTLQYVLWADSGWKPVPLVNIIEANAVKRSYQRALLYLHPDKLQQKGAAPYQKFIAEKVFDILQEAWDHFSNLGSL